MWTATLRLGNSVGKCHVIRRIARIRLGTLLAGWPASRGPLFSDVGAANGFIGPTPAKTTFAKKQERKRAWAWRIMQTQVNNMDMASRDRADGFVGGYKVDNFTVDMQRAGTGLVDIDGDGVYDMQYGMKIEVKAGQTSKPGGADGSKSMETPRPDGPQPTEQQINEGPYTGRHAGGWKMKRPLLAPADDREYGRYISMSNVHGTFFEQPKERWFEEHNAAKDTKPAEDFKMRLYPLDRDQYSPWEPSRADLVPMSKTVGSYATRAGGGKSTPGAIQPPKMGHIQGHVMPPSKGVKERGPVMPNVKSSSASDNPSWGGQREGDESALLPDPAPGYTGNWAAHRFDKGEEDLSMASRISRRRQQSIERRFSASPYAAQLAQDVLKLGDGVEFKMDTPYGWGAFPPQGLQ